MTSEDREYHGAHQDSSNYEAMRRRLEQRIAELEVERDGWRMLCERVDAYHGGSVDHRPAYVKAIRNAFEGESL